MVGFMGVLLYNKSLIFNIITQLFFYFKGKRTIGTIGSFHPNPNALYPKQNQAYPYNNLDYSNQPASTAFTYNPPPQSLSTTSQVY
jgi:hypothetical protein